MSQETLMLLHMFYILPPKTQKVLNCIEAQKVTAIISVVIVLSGLFSECTRVEEVRENLCKGFC